MAIRRSTTTDSLAYVRVFDWLRIAGLAVCCALACVLLWGAAGWARGLLSRPYPTDPLEGTLLHEARLLRAGEALYQPLVPDSFVSAPYPPLHPLLLALADSYPGPHVFWSGRALSLAALLLTALLLAVLVGRASGSWLAGLLAAALFLTSPPVVLWGTRVKPDMLGLLWVVLGLYCACRELETPGRRWWLAAAGSFVLALYTKQTLLAGPLAAGLAFLVADVRAWRSGVCLVGGKQKVEGRKQSAVASGAGDRLLPAADERMLRSAGFVGRLPLSWRTLAFALGYWAAVAGMWLAIDLLTGWSYSLHVLGLHPSEWRSLYLVGKYAWRFLAYWPLILLALSCLLWLGRSSRGLPVITYGLVAPWTLLGASEIGANHNHMLETMLALALAGGCALGWTLRSAVGDRQLAVGSRNGESYEDMPTRRAWGALAAVGLVLLQLVLLFAPQRMFMPELRPRDSLERYIVFLQNTPGEVLADNVGLLLAAGKPIRYDDPSTMGPVAANGVWDQSGLVREISERRFSAILIPDDVREDPYDNVGRWTIAMRRAIRDNYRLKFKDTIRIYVPKE